MAQFQGSRSAMLNGENPVIIEKSKKKKNIENPDNPIPIHVFTKSGTKYYLAKSNAYFNPNYKVELISLQKFLDNELLRYSNIGDIIRSNLRRLSILRI